MITQLKPWGNSQAIRISKEMIEESGFRSNQDLEITAKPGQIIITVAHPRLTLKERIRKYGPIRSYPEMDWGEPMGNERW